MPFSSLQVDHDRGPRALSRVLIIAPHGSYRTGPFIQAARQQGAEVLIASQGKHSIVSEYARGLQINFSDEDQALQTIVTAAQERPFSGIIGTDDSATVLAARAAEQLGLPHNPPQAVQIAARKDMARRCLSQSKVRIPDFRVLDIRRSLPEQLDGVVFPCVVKPVALSASRGVIRVNDTQQLSAAVERIKAILAAESQLPADAGQTLLLEQFISGQEVAVEGMLYDGELDILALFDKPDPMDGPFFEETYYITPSRLSVDIQLAIRDEVQAACHAYGLREGPVHAECRINADGVWILEVAARTIGGLCGRLLTYGTGRQLEEVVLAHAQGRRVTVNQQDGAAGVLMIPIPGAGVLKRVEGLLAAQQIPGVEEVNIQIRDGYELIPLPEGGSYLGFIFARGESSEEVERALRKAHACLNIVIGPLWKVLV
ncbi:MAG: ATP-grasp domain-containing protein [Gammaproteobacteria bacterium]|nr:ATP-grasp domain-containing protein [Gammaproteobacteria bacterium]MDH5651547.1 ATP-grasp domain-containing protein [Gammaproteobacteria bacterium]